MKLGEVFRPCLKRSLVYHSSTILSKIRTSARARPCWNVAWARWAVAWTGRAVMRAGWSVLRAGWSVLGTDWTVPSPSIS